MPRRVLESDGWKRAERFWLEGNSWTPFDGQSYHTEVLKDAPVAYWRLGEAAGSTTAVDETGNGHDGTYQGPTLEAVGVIERGSDFAASFDGTDDYVDMGSPDALNITGDLTLEAWVKVATSSSNIIITWANYYNSFPYHFIVQDTGVVTLNRDSTIASSGGTVDDGDWHHVMVTDDQANSQVTFYIDGVLDTQEAYSSAPSSGDGVLTLSRDPGSAGAQFDGEIDEVSVHDKVLTEAQVKEHYRLAFSRYAQTVLEDQPVAYWRLDETSGSTARDVAGTHDGSVDSGVDLTISGQVNSGADFPSDTEIVAPDEVRTTEPITIECWLQPGDLTTSRSYGGNRDSGSSVGCYVAVDSDQTVAYAAFGAGGGNSTGTVPDDGEYHHVVVTAASDGVVTFYIDGVDSGTISGVGPMSASTQSWRLGRNGNTGNYWRGFLDEYAIYDKILTPEQVETHYKIGAS